MGDQSKEERSGNVGGVLLAFVIGAVAGAAVALLYAPSTGQEMRDFLGEKAREGVRKAKDVAKDVYVEATGDQA